MSSVKGTTLKWSDGNSKVKKLKKIFGKTFSFGLPAFQSADGFKVCPGAGACAAICFARQGHYIREGVRACREHNLKRARRNLRAFVKDAVIDLIKLRAKLVRVHDSGDFFSQRYLDAWYEIARLLPGVRFYAYTKSVHLNIWKGKPGNFSLVQSEGGLWDADIDTDRAHARIFSTEAARKVAGYGDGGNTDKLAVQAKDGTKIGLVYHGNANLTPAQEKHFS
jgi:hypothetical protein